MRLYLTPTALGYLTQIILVALISGYVLWRVVKPERPQHMLWLAGFFISITAFISTLFLEVASLPAQRLNAVYCQNTVLGIALVCLIQFAYRFPARLPNHRWEARFALGCSGLYALWEAQYAVYRFGLLRSGIVEFRPNWSDYLLLAMLLWVPVAFLRQLCALDHSGSGFGRRLIGSLLRPATREARATRDLALIFLFVAGLNVFNIARAAHLLTASLANMGISLGILVALFAFALTYLNGQAETVSFIVKFAGMILTLVLATLGVVGWVVSPFYVTLYNPLLPNHAALRFTPNTRGGYDVSSTPMVWEDHGEGNLSLSESETSNTEGHSYCSAPLDFQFTFYGQLYQQLYVCNDGTIGMRQPLRYRQYQYHYGGGAPLIMALLLDLDPEISPGGVYALQESTRLIVTWERQRAFYHPQYEFSFQAVLYSDGVFDLVYRDMPTTFVYQPNDDPGANPWAIGALPAGLPRAEPTQLQWDALASTSVLSSGATGVIHDYFQAFREHLHAFLAPVAWLILVASALIVLGFPLLIHFNVVRPLKLLLHGVQRIEAGDYNVQIPLTVSDEIGFLTRAFNTLAAELAVLIHNLEERVTARTVALNEANARLSAEVNAREELIADLKTFSHTVAHDLKTPLAVITGYSSLMHELLSVGGDPELLKYSQQIAHAGTKMSRMIDGILVFASVRQANLKLAPLNMAAIVEEVKCSLQAAIAQTGARIMHPEHWPSVLGNTQWIEEVWSNYLSNALKYGLSPAQGSSLCVELGYTNLDLRLPIADSQPQLPSTILRSLQQKIEDPQSKIIFWVRDRGPGIAVELQAHLFTPFDRLGRKPAEGHGLGLSIVKRMIEKLGGKVGVESAPGEGSCFWFTLSVDDAALAAIPEANSEAFDALAARLALLDAALLAQLVQATQEANISDLQVRIAQLKDQDFVVAEAYDILLYHFDYEMMQALATAALALQQPASIAHT